MTKFWETTLKNKALELFEDTKIAKNWLLTPKEFLNRKAPLDPTNTNAQAEECILRLDLAEYGIFR